MLAAFALIEVDVRAGTLPQDRLPWLFGAGADGARGMLGAIATSMIGPCEASCGPMATSSEIR